MGGGTLQGRGLPAPWSRSRLALKVEFDTIKILPKNLQTLKFSLEILSWSLHSTFQCSVYLPVFCAPSKFCNISALKRKLVWISLSVFLPSFRTVSEVSTQFDWWGNTHSSIQSQIRWHKKKCPQVIINTRVVWLSQTALLVSEFISLQFHLLFFLWLQRKH